jgi:hypothetical protein
VEKLQLVLPVSGGVSTLGLRPMAAQGLTLAWCAWLLQVESMLPVNADDST